MTIRGSKTWDDVQVWKYSAGATQAGSYDTSGQWSLGPTTGGSVTHNLQSGANLTLNLVPPQSGNTGARINIEAFGTGIPEVYWYNGAGLERGVIYATSAGVWTFQYDTTMDWQRVGVGSVGGLSATGAWTIGASASTVAHTLNGAVTTKYPNAGATSSLEVVNSSTTANDGSIAAVFASVRNVGSSRAYLAAVDAATPNIRVGAFTNHIVNFVTNVSGGTVTAGSFDTSAQWTLGSGSGDQTHSFISGGTTSVFITANNAAGKDAILSVIANGSGQGWIHYQRSSSRMFASNNTDLSGPYVASNGTSWTTGTSDERLKKNITIIPNCLNMLMQIRPLTYQLIAEGDNAKTRAGVVAQDLLAAGYTWPVDTDNPDHYALTPDEMSALYIGAIQDLKNQFDAYVASHP